MFTEMITNVVAEVVATQMKIINYGTNKIMNIGKKRRLEELEKEIENLEPVIIPIKK